MLTIRLARTGRKNLANYRVVVADSHRAATGKFVSQLGHYNPHTKELVIDEDKTQKFLDNGAQPSSKMVRLLDTQKGIKLPDWAKSNLVEKQSKPKKQAEEQAEEGAAEAKSEAEVEAESQKDSEDETKEENSKDKKADQENAAESAEESGSKEDDKSEEKTDSKEAKESDKSDEAPADTSKDEK